jgi:hypothetical protein
MAAIVSITLIMVTYDPRAADYATGKLFVDKGEVVASPEGVAA